MKKYLMIGFAAIAFASCSNHDFETMSQEQIDKAKYDQKFVETFGTPDPNHTWGFGATTRAFTRADINVNGNLWESCPELGSTEEDDVVAYVMGLNPKPNTNPIQLENYYVTQVHCGTESYSNADGGVGIIGSAHMDHLMIAMESDATITNGTLSDGWQHINNFNRGDNTDWKGNTLVTSGGTYDFAYNGSEDAKYHNRWIAIDGKDVPKTGGGNYAGNYYVCFDFEATVDGYTNVSNIKYYDPVTGQWANSGNISIPGVWTEAELAASNEVFAIPVWGWTQEKGSYIERYVYVHLNNPEEVEFFNYSNAVGGNQAINPNSSYLDWIVRLVKAEPKNDDPDPDPITYAWRIMAEDLTVATNSDFDFNDVVFDAKIDATANKTYIKLLAAGGTLELYIGDESHEVHHLFNVGKTTMVNTINPDYNTAGVTFELPYYSSYDAIPIYVKKNGIWEPITAQKGEPASKFACPVGTEWQVEYTNIDEKYEHFTDWVSDETKPFWVEW